MVATSEEEEVVVEEEEGEEEETDQRHAPRSADEIGSTGGVGREDVSTEAQVERHREALITGSEDGLTPIEEGDLSMIEAPAATVGIESDRNVQRARIPPAARRPARASRRSPSRKSRGSARRTSKSKKGSAQKKKKSSKSKSRARPSRRR